MFDPARLWPAPRKIESGAEIDLPRKVRITGLELGRRRTQDLLQIGGVVLSTSPDAYPVQLKIEAGAGKPEGYVLTMGGDSAAITGADAPGLDYGLETFLQILAMCRSSRQCPTLTIRDHPHYRTRGFMVDMGRSVYPLPMLKRVVRILARLKMNQLHLHLYDDELCGLRFDGLPFGSENPYAIDMDGLGDLVRYAREHHVEIVPELEGWGHVGSLVHHRPELRGGPGMYAGSSFLISDESFALMAELLDRLVEVLEDRAVVHLGLDEATWTPGDDLPSDFTPSDMVGRYFDILRACGERHGKDLTLRLWADHRGRPIPDHVKPHAIIEPWQYWIANTAAIDRAIGRYSGEDKMRWIMGAGRSVAQYRGAYHATRYWARQAADSPNAEGVNITFWGANNLERNLLSLFAGSCYTWNPFPEPVVAAMDDYESYDRAVVPIMRWWQTNFRDAFPDEMLADQGPLVHMGYHLWGDHHGEPVAPTVTAAGTGAGHDYLHEHQE